MAAVINILNHYHYMANIYGGFCAVHQQLSIVSKTFSVHPTSSEVQGTSCYYSSCHDISCFCKYSHLASVQDKEGISCTLTSGPLSHTHHWIQIVSNVQGTICQVKATKAAGPL